jgi:hypothetical protein
MHNLQAKDTMKLLAKLVNHYAKMSVDAINSIKLAAEAAGIEGVKDAETASAIARLMMVAGDPARSDYLLACVRTLDVGRDLYKASIHVNEFISEFGKNQAEWPSMPTMDEYISYKSRNN